MISTRRHALHVLGAAALTPLVSRSPARAADTIRIGAGFVEGQAQGYYAQDAGFFEQAGLNVRITQLPSGSATSAAVASGDLQFGVGNPLPLAQARLRGVPLVVVAPGAFFNASTSTQFIVTGTSSPVKSAKDLLGATVAVSSLRGLDQLAASAWLDKNGVDLATIKFIELPQPAMAEALVQKRIAAAVLQDPEYSAAGNRIRTLGNAYAAIAPKYYQSVWFSTVGYVAKNSELTRRFVSAIVQAGLWSETHREEAGRILQKYTKVEAPRTTLSFGPNLDPAMIAPVLEDAVKYKILQTALPTSELVWNDK
jgi:NitT/TauT family transport system substrate-binding protein